MSPNLSGRLISPSIRIDLDNPSDSFCDVTEEYSVVDVLGCILVVDVVDGDIGLNA